MMKIGQHYSNSGNRLVEIKRVNADNTYATVFHTKLRTMWVPQRVDLVMREQDILDFLDDGDKVARWESVYEKVT